MVRRALFLIVAFCLVLPVAGCAAPGTRPGSRPGSSGAPQVATSHPPVTYEAMSVKAVRRGPTPTTVLIDAEVPAGGDGCYENLRAEKEAEESNTIFVHVLLESARDDISGACPTTAVETVTFTEPKPFGDRLLSIDEQAVWAPDGDGYRRCDTNLGCTPPADHCTAPWIQQAKAGLDIPAHSGTTEDHCDQQWLVLRVNVNTAACGAGGRPGCSAPPNVTRYFFRFDTAWRLIAGTKAGGCAAVKAKAPDFPVAICQNLPPAT